MRYYNQSKESKTYSEVFRNWGLINKMYQSNERLVQFTSSTSIKMFLCLSEISLSSRDLAHLEKTISSITTNKSVMNPLLRDESESHLLVSLEYRNYWCFSDNQFQKVPKRVLSLWLLAWGIARIRLHSLVEHLTRKL